MEKKSILYVSKTSLLSAGGGGEERARQVITRLSNTHDITVVASNTDPGLDRWDKLSGAELRHVRTVPDFLLNTSLGFYAPRYLFGIISIPIIASLLLRRDYDVVVENMTPFPTLTVVLASIFSVPTIGVRHEFDGKDAYQNYDPVSATILLTLQNLLRIGPYAAIITPTEHVATQLNEYGLSKDTLHVIPNGITTEPYENHDSVSSDCGTTGSNIVTISRLIKQKGIDRLLESFSILCEQRDDVTLTVAGEGPQRESLEAHANHLGMRNQVSFVGYISEEEKPDFLMDGDVFVLASRREGFGLVLLEAMAAGTPAVAWDLPVFHEFFDDGEHGYLVESPEEMSDTIETLLGNDELKRRMGSAARNRADLYTWKRTAEETEAVIHSVVGR